MTCPLCQKNVEDVESLKVCCDCQHHICPECRNDDLYGNPMCFVCHAIRFNLHEVIFKMAVELSGLRKRMESFESGERLRITG